MATSRSFVGLGEGLLLVAGGAASAYQVWDCATDARSYKVGAALPCRPVGQAEGLSQPHNCPSGCGAGECNCPSLASCTAQPGCGWCGDAAPGVCMPGRQSGPVGPITSDPISGLAPAECFAWSYGTTPKPPAVPHSYSYLQADQLLDYSAADGKYRVWRLPATPKPGCPGVLWPPDAAGKLAVLGHTLAALPPPRAGAFSLLDYEPTRGDYRLGLCNRSQTVAGGRLDCHTSVNGTWHTGGLQLLWVGQGTLLRYSQGTGDYSLWRFSPLSVELAGEEGAADDVAPFEASPVSEGTLLSGDGKRLRHARLSYLGRDVLMASEPTTGYVGLFKRALPSVEASVDVFSRHWEAPTTMRGWQFTHVGGDVLMMFKASSAAYRTLNCSAVFREKLPAAGLGRGALPGPPCSVILEGSLPDNAPCDYDKPHCLMAPHCGWCLASAQCVPASEEGVCSGSCAHGQLLYGSTAVGDTPAPDATLCEDVSACDQCTELPQCGWCGGGGGGGGSCMQATDAALGECGSGRFLQHDSSACVADDPLAGLVDQVAMMARH